MKYRLTTNVSDDTFVVIMETKTINLRDLPEDFVRMAKAYAALSGMTLKDFVMQAVQSAMQGEIQPTVPNAAFIDNKKRSRKK